MYLFYEYLKCYFKKQKPFVHVLHICQSELFNNGGLSILCQEFFYEVDVVNEPENNENFKINLVNIENGNTELILNTDETNYYDIQFILTPQGEWTAWLYSESKKTNSLIYLKTPHSITTIPDYPNKIHPVLLKKDHWLGIHISKNGMNVDILDLFSGDKRKYS